MDAATNVMLSANNSGSGSLGERLGFSRNISAAVTLVLYIVSMIGSTTVGVGAFGWWVLATFLFVLSFVFLVGPSTHLSGAFDDEHKYGTIAILITELAYLIISFIKFSAKKGLLIFDTIVLLLAGLYYIISYIPFARTLLSGIYKGSSSTVVSGINAAV